MDKKGSVNRKNMNYNASLGLGLVVGEIWNEKEKT